MNPLSLMLLALLPGQAQQSAFRLEPCDVAPATLAKMDQKTLTVKEGEQSIKYYGVPLRAVLATKLGDPKSMAKLRELSDAVLFVRGSDGYRAAVSAAEVAMDEKGERFLLALEREGKPLDERHAPLQLVIPGDPKRVRWVRNVIAVELARPEAGKK